MGLFMMMNRRKTFYQKQIRLTMLALSVGSLTGGALGLVIGIIDSDLKRMASSSIIAALGAVLLYAWFKLLR